MFAEFITFARKELKMRGKAISWRFLTASNLVLLCLLLMVITFGCKEKTEEVTRKEQTKEIVGEELADGLAFDLSEVSISDLSQIFVSRYFLRGQSAYCKEKPSIMVKYPRLKSDKPLYGSVHFDGASAESKGRGMYHFILDESAGTGRGYNRLYLDHNCDLYLRNEKPLKPTKNPLDEALQGYSFLEQEVYFESFELTFDFGNAGKHAIEIMPRLRIYQGGRSNLNFIATKARKGEIEIGEAKYDALLGYKYYIGRPFDQTGTSFYLIPKKEPQRTTTWSGGDNLKKAMHVIGGKYYRFATTPTGDKLFVRPYKGQLGTFEIGAGGRNIQEIAVQGSLRSEETAIAIGGETERGWPKPAKSCRLPVGDYLPAMVTITLGRLRISVSENYHTDGQPRGRGSRPDIYGIKIREDKPYVFDFSNKPEVMFASPAKDHRVKLDQELMVKAVLIDPVLDIMIRHLDDTTRKQKKEYLTSDGQKRTYERDVSLDPKVIITRADGEKVAEGVMPFG